MHSPQVHLPQRTVTRRAAWVSSLPLWDQLTNLQAERESGVLCSPVTLEMGFLFASLLDPGEEPGFLPPQAQVFIQQLLVGSLHLPELGSVLAGIPWRAREMDRPS